jgi:uncharacterized membrane protein (UPF0127 family)
MRCGLLITCLVTLTLSVRTEAATGQNGLIQISMPNGATIQAEIADTTEKRAKGLMYRDSLAKDRGMLFTFAEPQLWTFWMKNTRMPLDIIWMDGKKRIVHIERNVPTCSRTDDGCPQYQPNDNAMYVLELAAGVADALKLQRGSVLKFQTSS